MPRCSLRLLLAMVLAVCAARATLSAAEHAAITDKTLVAWVSPASLDQHGGGVLTLEKPGDVFDAIVFAEHAPARWMAGSDNGKRSTHDQQAWPAEDAAPGAAVQIAVVYHGREVSIYRDARPYASYTMASEPESFDAATATVLLGMRHLHAQRSSPYKIVRDDCFFNGAIDDARIYDHALDAAALAALKPKVRSSPEPWAWWPFIDDSTADAMGTFPPGVLVDGARVEGGRLILETFSGRMLVDRTKAPDPATLYHEALRPLVHFTARQWTRERLDPNTGDEGWLNDLNGLVWVDGEYHLFAQRWWRCWLHATSTDLVHWTELPPAIWMGGRFGGVQSGSAVIDRANTSGLATSADVPVMVAFWASTDERYQCLSYSNDHGRTWTKYAGNPILTHGNRDPKVFWHEPTKRWIMALYTDHQGYVFFSSSDLKAWTEMSSLPGFYECPDLFELPVGGDAQRRKWVVVNGDGSYVVGAFDGTTFKPEGERTVACGPDFYATQTWNTMPTGDTRRVQVAWMRSRGIYPGMPFNQQVTFPCVLTLEERGGRLVLCRNPIPALAGLHHGAATKLPAQELAAGQELALPSAGAALHVIAELELSPGAAGELLIRGEMVRFTDRQLAMRKFTSPLAAPVARMRLELIVDRTSIEAFVAGGEASLAACFKAAGDAMSLRCTAGTVKVASLEAYELESMWQGATPR